MIGIKDLLLNVFIIIVPIFVYQIFWMDRRFCLKEIIPNKVVIGSLAALSLILVMSFPFTLFPGFFFDLRMVVIILGTLYGGFRVGVSLTIVLLSYRFYIGGEGFYISFLVYTILFLLAYVVRKRYIGSVRIKKLLLAMGLALITSLQISIISYVIVIHKNILLENSLVLFFLFYSLITMLSTGLSIYLVESIRENELLRSQVIRSEKLNVMSELAASFAHEIRNPMTVIRGFLQLIKQSVADEKHNKYIDLMMDEVNRSQTIINDYLSLAKPELEEMENVNISEQIRYIVDLMMPYALIQSVEIQTRLEETLLIKANKDKLKQCFINVTKNGIEAMPNGGILHIRAYQVSKSVLIEISDTGMGMSEEEVNRLGTPYYSTKEKGTGIGMIVCFRYIEVLQGKLDVQSEKEKGTRISIRIPIVDS